jgi:hypothetical protein
VCGLPACLAGSKQHAAQAQHHLHFRPNCQTLFNFRSLSLVIWILTTFYTYLRYLAPNAIIQNVWQRKLHKNMEASGRGLFYGIIPHLPWRMRRNVSSLR